MKRIIAILMACLFALSFTIAFAQGEKKLGIVCTTFPQYDWVRQILGDRVNDVDLTLLLDNGIDLHNYQPTAGDIIKIAQSDLFIYAGGESDGWVDDVLLLLDEPVSGLDPSATAEMYAIIRRLNKEEGITVLMISHDIFAATREADHILHLARRPLFFGSTEDYRKSDVGKAFLRMEKGERA